MTIWRVSKDYRSTTVWTAADTGELISTTTITPRAGLTRRERYDELRIEMKTLRVKIPKFQP